MPKANKGNKILQLQVYLNFEKCKKKKTKTLKKCK